MAFKHFPPSLLSTRRILVLKRPAVPSEKVDFLFVEDKPIRTGFHP
mgnify:CR=1 FL=1